MKVYLVTDGDYSDFSIEAIFSTKELAIAFQKRFRYDSVGEWEVDSLVDLHKGLTYYSVFMKKDGMTEEVEEHCGKRGDVSYNYQYSNDIVYALHASVWAKDKKHAVKILNEKRSIILANNAWGCNDFLKQFDREEIANELA